MSKKAKALARRYGRKTDIIEIVQEIISEQYHVNAFDYPTYPIITKDEQIQPMKWGLIPFWTKSEEDAISIRSKTLNARSETIYEKPSYRKPAINRRCIIPATGFFEWRHEGKARIPYYIFLKEEEIFSMAGLYDRWHDRVTGDTVTTFTQLITDANPLLAYIHNNKKRMPAILYKKDEEKWLDPNLPREEAQKLLVPYDEKRMDAYRIEKEFMKRDAHDPEIIRPAG